MGWVGYVHLCHSSRIGRSSNPIYNRWRGKLKEKEELAES